MSTNDLGDEYDLDAYEEDPEIRKAFVAKDAEIERLKQEIRLLKAELETRKAMR